MDVLVSFNVVGKLSTHGDSIAQAMGRLGLWRDLRGQRMPTGAFAGTLPDDTDLDALGERILDALEELEVLHGRLIVSRVEDLAVLKPRITEEETDRMSRRKAGLSSGRASAGPAAGDDTAPETETSVTGPGRALDLDRTPQPV